MTEIVEGLGGAERDRVGALRKGGSFFWVDLSLTETSPHELGEVLAIPKGALEVLLGFGEARPSTRRLYADGQQVVFTFSAYLESAQLAEGDPYRLGPVEVRVLVCGEYLLTLHEEPLSLPHLLAPYAHERRSEQYVVYAVLDAMLVTAFDALDEVEQTMDDLAAMSADIRTGRVRMATLRAMSSQLSSMRRRAGPQRGLFERIGVEIKQVEGLEADREGYFDHLVEQISRLVEAIDAAANALATLIDLRLNETSYWLTVVATVFLPLTFITGFFGMNFGWMVGEIDTQTAFWLLGIGTPVVGVALILRFVVRGSPVEAETLSGRPRPPAERLPR